MKFLQGFVLVSKNDLFLSPRIIGKTDAEEGVYKVVQENAMPVWAGEGNRFQELLAADPRIQRWLKPKELAALFDLDHTLKNVDTIFKRAFGKAKN